MLVEYCHSMRFNLWFCLDYSPTPVWIAWLLCVDKVHLKTIVMYLYESGVSELNSHSVPSHLSDFTKIVTDTLFLWVETPHIFH